MNTIKPRYLSGIATLFWGYQTELLWFALPMAIILETRYFLNRRWALEKTDFYRIADLTSVGLVGMVMFLFLNAREYHFITTLISWLPILLFPLVTVLAYSTTPRMSLDIMFYSLRRQREPVEQSWDMDYVFLGACLLAAGLNRDGLYYFPVAGLILLFALYNLRSSRFSKKLFLLSMTLVFLSATAFHYGIRGAHLELKAKTEQWIANWISQRTDPMKTRTALGYVGRLKLSDAIAFRIQPLSGQPDFPRLLREATYNAPLNTDWEVFDPRFSTVTHADDFRWEFSDEVNYVYPEANIYLEFDRDRSLIPVPAQLTEIVELPALDVNISAYGTIQGIGLVPAPNYKIRYDNEIHLGDPPTSPDLIVPEEHRALFNKIAPEKIPEQDAVSFVQNYFSDFRYTLYQSDVQISSKPLEHFMLERKAGHCEYFASATALLLRHLGVPSRYVVGFSIQEWNEYLQMYIVRKRHAHAWVTAYVGGRWIIVDTTPSEWLAMEESQSNLMQPVWDFLGNNRFMFQLWWNDQKIEDYETELYIIGFILVLILIWRISTSEQVILTDEDVDSTMNWILPGAESPFFRIEDQLSSRGFRRGRGELMTGWLVRIDRPELLPLLMSHNRWRFDPRGISIEERKHLSEQVEDWLVANQPETLST